LRRPRASPLFSFGTWNGLYLHSHLVLVIVETRGRKSNLILKRAKPRTLHLTGKKGADLYNNTSLEKVFNPCQRFTIPIL
jgi:hypothetical protein